MDAIDSTAESLGEAPAERVVGTRSTFSIRSILILISCIAVFFSLVSVGIREGGVAGGIWFLAAAAFVAACSFGMMLREVVYGRYSRKLASGLLAAALGFAPGTLAIFMLTIALDAFAIFALPYVGFCCFLLPLSLITGAIGFAIRSSRLDWLGVGGFCLWCGCVAFAHLWIIAQASASV